MKTQSLVALDLYHVRYQKGDPLGHFLAWISMLPIYLDVMLFSHFLYRREIQSLLAHIGQLTTMFICSLLKASVKQKRPKTCALLQTCDSYGWPSCHATLAFFHAAYFTLLTFKRKEKHKWVVGLAYWALAFLTMCSRVYLGYHTASQVIGGAAVGSFCSAVWFWVVNSLLFRYFPAIEASYLGRMLYLKDTSHIANVLKLEYHNARASRKNVDLKLW